MSTTYASSKKETAVKKSFDASSLLFALSFGVYALLLVMMTLMKNRLSLGGLWNPEAHQYRSIDLELFNGFENPSVWWAPWTNTFGNIGLFMPLGFFLYRMLRKMEHRFPFVETVLFAGVISLSIEVLQWVFAIGYSDIDDLLCNTIGGLIGASVAALISPKSLKKISGLIMAGSLAVMAMMLYSSFGG
ncbi:VanZ family protein [Corynebacterium suranareeae]|nr:VanZ family protein [Corynebacterium suranareeae]